MLDLAGREIITIRRNTQSGRAGGRLKKADGCASSAYNPPSFPIAFES
ncbi:hypothetical protein NEIELOOT_01124 [Neisseria elongata subsp. glycolytica ATCC 29315]|uniref:Uncharacterized protein n=1 Tax=Neisseria elongata subsp. glycolytica ATCC 29315 TaxID=546263 RepID=D4DPY7_NEIEG|nr:hypothetical protein NEIELOOT_01124 [Neisseria elongata subsp. glycolytica ATCC 29315]